jgi:excisionase family DNA binding protein
MTPTIPPTWLNSAEAATYLRMPSVRALYQAVRRGLIPVHRVGRRSMRFNRTELDRALTER